MINSSFVFSLYWGIRVEFSLGGGYFGVEIVNFPQFLLNMNIFKSLLSILIKFEDKFILKHCGDGVVLKPVLSCHPQLS